MNTSYAEQDHVMDVFNAAKKRNQMMRNRKPFFTKVLDFIGNYRYYRRRGLSIRLSFEMAGKTL